MVTWHFYNETCPQMQMTWGMSKIKSGKPLFLSNIPIEIQSQHRPLYYIMYGNDKCKDMINFELTKDMQYLTIYYIKQLSNNRVIK